METIKIGVSGCLIGDKVRYDGDQKRDRYITDVLGRVVELVSVCPEVECGLFVPREAMRLTEDPQEPRLVTVQTGIDHTERMRNWAVDRLDGLTTEGLCGFIFKSRSPSCSIQGVKIYNMEGVPFKRGAGIFAKAFMERFPLVPVEDEDRLQDLALRENFIERLFVYRRWLQFIEGGGHTGALVEFHMCHKLIMLSHSPKDAAKLGRYVAGSKSYSGLLNDVYIATMMEGLCHMATARKHTNVLSHIMGYFKKVLVADERQELLDTIEEYHEGLIPLVVPVAMLNHYVRKYDEPYLKKQLYLRPHPLELMLRNHV